MSKRTKPTAGPWEYWPGDEAMSPCVRVDGRVIATVYGKPSDPEGVANGHLVKASPELYKACSAAAQAIGAIDGNASPELNRAFQACMAAMARAMGRQA